MRQSALTHTCKLWRAESGSAGSFLSLVTVTCVVLLALAIIAPLTAKAQLAGNGAISGTVTDPTGAVISNATITVVAVDTNQSTVRQTTSAGDYNVTPLPPGNYTVTVAAPASSRSSSKM